MCVTVVVGGVVWVTAVVVSLLAPRVLVRLVPAPLWMAAGLRWRRRMRGSRHALRSGFLDLGVLECGWSVCVCLDFARFGLRRGIVGRAFRMVVCTKFVPGWKVFRVMCLLYKRHALWMLMG